jgi:hypothetical protein
MTTMTNGDCGGDDTAKQSASMSSIAMACRRDKRIFFFLFRVFLFILFFFASSTDLVACSFDHLCRELTKMEIEK